jgi:serine protease Do
MFKRSWKVSVLLAAMAVVVGAQTAAPERRCESSAVVAPSILTDPVLVQSLLDSNLGLLQLGAMPLLAGQTEFPIQPLTQIEMDPFLQGQLALFGQEGRAEAGPLVFSYGPGSYLGVYLDEVTAERVSQLKLEKERGAVVTKVIEDGPAAKAGIRENDVITSFNGRPVESVRELQRLLGETPSGRSVPIEIYREGSRQTVNLTVGERSVMRSTEWQAAQKATEQARKELEEAMKRAPRVEPFGNFTFRFPEFALLRGAGRLGIVAESMSPQLAEFFGAKEGGVLVSEVRENSPAARAGLKAGDVIFSVDGELIKNTNSLVTALAKKEEGQVTLKVIRDRGERTINVTLEKSPRPATTPRQVVRTRNVRVV